MSKLNENGKCRCGFDEDSPSDPACLPLRTIIAGKYLIGKMTAMNGEGITYIGFDTENEEKVFVEEFMPQKIARRNDLSGEVMPEQGCEAQYKTLMSDFRELFSALRDYEYKEDKIVTVTDIVSDRGTVYAVYKYIKTITYNDYLLHNGGEFTWPQVKKLFMPLLTCISHLNKSGIIHRGISPETIRVNAKGQLMLSGFGTVLAYSKNDIIVPEIASGYAAPEQYSQGDWQGEWTDVYSVAAVMYKSLTGTLPADAEERKQKDMLCPLRELESSVPENVDDAVINAMALEASVRTSSADEFTAELLESAQGNTVLYKPQKGEELKGANTSANNAEDKKEIKQANRKIGLMVSLGVGLVLIIIVIFLFRFTEILGLGKRNNGNSGDSLSSETGDVSDGYGIAVPNFIGRFRTDVEGNSQYSQFTLTFAEEANSAYSKGMIFDQSVKYKTEVSEGTEIVLKVSAGPQTVPMPKCTEMKLEDAAELLTRLGIVYTAIPNYSAEEDYGIVFSQSIEEGEDVVIGNTLSKVTIYYSANEQSSSSVTYNSNSSGGVVHQIG